MEVLEPILQFSSCSIGNAQDKESYIFIIFLAGAKRAALYVGWSQARHGAAAQILN